MDDKLKLGLENDYLELQGALTVSLWKSVHVLSGSVIEAILVYAIQIDGNYTGDVLKKTLSDLVSIAREKGILTERSEQLCSAVKNFRNLIHPGRIVRLEEYFDHETAQVCFSLVNIIAREVRIFSESRNGYSAEWVLNRFIDDHAAFSVINNITDKLHSSQKVKLLTENIPNAIYEEADTYKRSNLNRLFDYVHKRCDREEQRQVGNIFSTLVREGEVGLISSYIYGIFKATHLKHYNNTSRDVILSYAIQIFRDDGSYTGLN